MNKSNTAKRVNGTIQFTLSRGFWTGRSWNGEEWINWKGLFETKGQSERFAASRGYKALFIVH